MEDKILEASKIKQIQLEKNEFEIENGIIRKIFIGERYFYIYTNNNIDYTKETNLFIFCHGSRDIAMDCILSSTSLISTFGDNFIVIFGQCTGIIQEPYIHKNFGNIAYGEIYWGITNVQNKDADIEYINKIVNFADNNYKINKRIIMGHSNGGVFVLLMAIYLPNIFDAIISHQGGIGWDPLFGLDFELIENNYKKSKLLFYTGSLDGHKSVCEIAHNIFLAENYESDIIVIEGLKHKYKKDCEITIKNWIEKKIEFIK